MAKRVFLVTVLLCCLCLVGLPQAMAANTKFHANKIGDMSDLDPLDPKMVPTGDTIKIAIVASFSGPAALVGEIYWISVLWAARNLPPTPSQSRT